MKATASCYVPYRMTPPYSFSGVGSNTTQGVVEVRTYEPEVEAGVPLPGICILYSHGNQGSLDRSENDLRALADYLRCVFVAYEFPGYTSPEVRGCATEVNVNAAALAAFDWMAKTYPSHCAVTWGYSLGSSFATYVASQRQARVKAVILQSPIASMNRVVTGIENEPWLLEKYFDAFNNYHRLATWSGLLQGGVVLMHGTADPVVPAYHSEMIQRACEKGGMAMNRTDMTRPIFLYDPLEGCKHEEVPLRKLVDAVMPLMRRLISMKASSFTQQQ